MAIRVGRWDCTVCGNKGNMGPETHCTNCGASRPPNVKFYLPSDAEIVSEKIELKAAKAGADWICGHCEAQNKATATFCGSCGNPKDSKTGDTDLQSRTFSPTEVPRSGGLHESTAAGETYRKEHRSKIETKPGYKRKRPKGLLALILSSPILAGIVYYLLQAFPLAIEVEVIGHEWERSIQFKHYEAVTQEAWKVPAEAFNVSSFRAVHHYDRVSRGYETRTRTVRDKVGEETYVCGQKDLGNGYFEDVYCSRPIYKDRQETYREEVFEDVPVYRKKYRFDLMQWVGRPEYLLTNSAKDHSPSWPEAPKRGKKEDWREGPKQEMYRLVVREEDGDEHSEEVGYRFWTTRNVGDKVAAEKSRFLDIYYGITEMGKDQ